MKQLVGALVVLAAAVAGMSPAHADVAPTITSLTLGVHSVVTDFKHPCADVPVTIQFSANGMNVQQIQVPIEQRMHETSPTYIAAATPASGQTIAMVTLHYCNTEFGVGRLVVGDCRIQYQGGEGDASVDQSVTDPTYDTFDAEQRATAALTGHRGRHHMITLTAKETYREYQDNATHRAGSTPATLQRRSAGHWRSFAPQSSRAGIAVFSLKARHKHRYRVVFAATPSVMSATTSEVTV
ncbi:MAG TPA: hypothetical protein VHD81_00070 [Mycobacteriales bacterium]|nr:hypothetical protein [Mycobacteriales bacterium]